ncbi:MAG TPA: hypothetical protein VFZ34_24815 [Blastocatellia bacterium]|nr:hypothetical protein [Blastocatellia bacterium]
MIKLSDYPQLSLIAWQRHKDEVITEQEALALYEANWRWIEEQTLTPKERELIARLKQDVGHGVLNV